MEKPEWEPSRARRLHAEEDEPGGNAGMAWMAGLSLVGFLVILLVVIMLKRGDPPAPPAAKPEEIQAGITRQIAETPVRSPAALLAEAQSVVEKFLGARTVTEIMDVVDEPDTVATKISRLHPDGILEAPGLGALGNLNESIREGSHLTIPVRTKDYKIRLITLREDPSGLKVDWESWAGWSDIPWERFGTDDASTTGVFRVVLRPTEYYNYDFADEKQWQSYQLESPDGIHSFYGYVERGSPLQLSLQSSLGDYPEARLMLKLEHPSGTRGRGQARITQLVSDDWIDPERKKQP